MIGVLEQHAERAAETGSLLLVKALSAVVHDFNTALNEQFGDNFKRLNEGVERHLTQMLAKSLEMANKDIADHSRLASDR